MHLYGALCVLSLLLLSPLSRASISPWPHANHDSGHSNAASESVPSFYRYCAEPKELREASSVIIPRPGLQLFVSETDPAYAPNNNISVTLIDMKTGSTTNFTFSGFAFLGIDPVGELRLYAWSSTMQGLVVSTLYAAFSLVDGSALWQTNITGDYPAEPRQLVNSYTDTIDVFVPSRAAPKTFATFRIAGRTGAQVWQAVATLNSSSAVAHVRPVAALPSGDVVVRAYTADAAVAELAGVDGRTGTFKWVSGAFGLSSYVSQEDVTVLLADGAYVVYWIGAEIVALDSATGALLWRNATVLPADTQPAVASVRAFGRTMLALQSSSSVFVVDPLTGHKHATYSHLNPLGGYTLYSVRSPQSAPPFATDAPARSAAPSSRPRTTRASSRSGTSSRAARSDTPRRPARASQ